MSFASKKRGRARPKLSDPGALLDALLSRLRSGESSLAEQIRRLCLRHPAHSGAAYALGCLALENGQGEEARHHLKKAQALQHPRPLDVTRNLLIAAAMCDDAEELQQQWASIKGTEKSSLEPLRSALRAAHVLKQYDMMALCLELWQEEEPDNVRVTLNQAMLALEKGNEKEAESILDQVPKDIDVEFDVHVLFFNALHKLNNRHRVYHFLRAYDKLDREKPLHIQAIAVQAIAVNQWEKATELYEYAVQHHPHLEQDLLYARLNVYQQSCQWEKISALIPRYMEAVQEGKVQPEGLFRNLSLPGLTDKDHRLLAEKYVQRFDKAKGKPMTFVRAARKGRRLKIGYLSADYKNHPVTQLLVEIIERHDREAFETVAYDITPQGKGFWRDRILNAFDQVVQAKGLSDKDLIQRIRHDTIDILIDLQGDTSHSRCWLFRQQLAPVQVGWLGFAGSTGGISQYIIADPHSIPRQAFAHFPEKVVWMPHTYMPNDAQRTPVQAPPRLLEKLPEDKLVFVCFNQHYKITEEMFTAWCRVLQQVPNSVLWLQGGHTFVQSRLQEYAKDRGIDAARIIFAQRKPQHIEHLARLQLADIALDTRPYNSHATCVDALWAGVPLVTLSGDSMASRVAASLLMTADLPELIAKDVDDFVKIAVDLAHDEKRRQSLRQSLIAARNTSTLFDPQSFTRNLEAAYEAMYARFEQGLAPDHIAVSTNAPHAKTEDAPTVQVLLEQGQYWLSNENLSKAWEFFQQVLHQEADNAQALHSMGLIHGLAGKYEQALPLLERSVALAPEVAWFQDNLKKMRQKAGMNYANILQDHLQKGMALHNEGNLDAARDQYCFALVASPQHPTALHYLGLVLVQQGSYAEGLKKMRVALQVQPHNAVFLENYKKAEALALQNGWQA